MEMVKFLLSVPRAQGDGRTDRLWEGSSSVPSYWFLLKGPNGTPHSHLDLHCSTDAGRQGINTSEERSVTARL